MVEWLQSLVPWGTEVIIWVQSLSNQPLDTLFLLLTQLGYEEFYLLALPLLYWCIHKQAGVSIGYLAMLSAWANNAVKYAFQIPRPSDPRIHIAAPETSPSFPSGHAQNAIAFWGYLAHHLRHPVFTAMACILILGISLSRVVLGVHYPQDILGGLAIGLVLLVIFVHAEPPVRRWLTRQKTVQQVMMAIAGPFVLMFLYPYDMQGQYPPEEAITTMSGLVGLGVGLIMEQAWVRFRINGPCWQRILRLVVGFAVVALLYGGPKLLVPEEAVYGLQAVIRFARYALVGWAVAFLGPWLFVRLGLATQQEE